VSDYRIQRSTRLRKDNLESGLFFIADELDLVEARHDAELDEIRREALKDKEARRAREWAVILVILTSLLAVIGALVGAAR
jgi:hypothetical protein